MHFASIWEKIFRIVVNPVQFKFASYIEYFVSLVQRDCFQDIWVVRSQDTRKEIYLLPSTVLPKREINLLPKKIVFGSQVTNIFSDLHCLQKENFFLIPNKTLLLFFPSNETMLPTEIVFASCDSRICFCIQERPRLTGLSSSRTMSPWSTVMPIARARGTHRPDHGSTHTGMTHD